MKFSELSWNLSAVSTSKPHQYLAELAKIALAAGLEEEEFKSLLEHSSPEHNLSQVLTAMQVFYRDQKHSSGAEQRPFQVLIQAVDSSPYCLTEWLAAIDFFYAWLHRRKKTACLLDVCDYLSCCTAMEGEVLKLMIILQEALQQYGFEKAKPYEP